MKDPAGLGRKMGWGEEKPSTGGCLAQTEEHMKNMLRISLSNLKHRLKS